MNRSKTDVLVIGGGAAGIRAAVEAANGGASVTLINNTLVTASGSTFSRVARGWGIQALLDDEYCAQHIELFYDEIISVGQGVCDPELVRILVEESGDRVKDLLAYGVEFKRTGDGHFYRATGCFSDAPRALITADFDNLTDTFLSILERHRVIILTGTVIDLLARDGICSGAVIFDEYGELLLMESKATIIATGGGGAIYENHLCGAESTGDGYALAIRAGAELVNMEFIQFMLGIKNGNHRQFLPRHLLHQEMILLDGSGHPVLERRLPQNIAKAEAVHLRQKHCPASTCDAGFAIDHSVWQAARDTGAVHWNAGNKPSVNAAQVVHMAHAFNGGIKINAQGASSLCGLFAAGEAAAGPHGADRIGGCMLTATQVFGKRAGQFAAARAKQVKHRKLKPNPGARRPELKKEGDQRKEREILIWSERTIRQAMHRHANIVRSEKGLQKCRQVIIEAESRLESMEGATRENFLLYNKIRNMIDVGKMIVQSAIDRNVSLGSHFRVDAGLGTWERRVHGAMQSVA